MNKYVIPVTQVLGLIRVSYCGKASDKPSPNWGFLVDDLGSCKSTPGKRGGLPHYSPSPNKRL